MPTLDPVLLFFILGVTAGLLRADVRLPVSVYDLISMLLLIAIGLKGGIEMARQPLDELVLHALAVMAMGSALTMFAYPVLRFAGKFKRHDAASIAAHYGSVSVATFAVATSYFASNNVEFEPHMPFLLAVMEIPAILVGILLARGFSRELHTGKVMHEIFLGKGVVLLVGGLLIGWAAGSEGLVSIKPLFFDLFKGILALFLLEMGIITATQISSLRHHGMFLIMFGIGMPLASSVVGMVVGLALGLSPGGIAMLAVLAASASYIAVPAAMRISVPEANPTLSLTASLGVTFPFNVLVGIPLYHALTNHFLALIGK